MQLFLSTLCLSYSHWFQNLWSRNWAFILLCWGIFFSQIPLFNLLSYEFAFVTCLPISYLGAHSGFRSSINRLTSSIYSQWFSALKSSFALALLPIIPILITAFWVRNCNWIDGLLFYGLLPIASLIISIGYGLFLAQLTRTQWLKKPLTETRALLFFTLIFISVALWSVIAVIATPIVDPFTTFMGYYPGAIYDEELVIGGRLALSRLEDLLIILFLLTLIQKQKRLFAFCFLLSVHSCTWLVDLHRPQFWVQSQLGGQAKSKHFVMYHPQSWSTTQAVDMLKELEFNYQELSNFFKLSPQRTISAYFYQNTEQKKRLMGAGHTLIAKPWQYSIHIHAPYVGDRVITHELSHVFSAEIAPAPHHLSMRYTVLPHMSLIEGLAVAATWTRGRGSGLLSRLSPHQWTAALQRLDLAPPMKQLLQPSSFYGYNSSLAYTMCGSFVRFYRDTQGQHALNRLYATGGTAHELSQTIEEWTTWLTYIPLSEQILLTAKALLNRPSIFAKVCAHELANRRNQAQNHMNRGDYEQALKIWRSIESDAPHDQEAVLSQIQLLFLLNQKEKALKLTQDTLKQAKDQERALSYLVESRLKEWLVDLASPTQNESLHNNYQSYTELIEQSLNRSVWRRLAIKRYAYVDETDPKFRELLLQFLNASSLSFEERKESLNSILQEWPNSAEIHYLLARTYMNQAEHQQALNSFSRALDLGLSHESLIYESLHLKALCLFKLKRFQEAHQAFSSFALRQDLSILDGEHQSLTLWSRRSLFFDTVQLDPHSP